MSDAENQEDAEATPGLARTVYRTVGPTYRSKGEGSMDAIGWSMFLGLVVLLFPLLPFFVLVWLISKLLDAISPDRESVEA